MTSMSYPEPDLQSLSERIRAVADVLRRVPPDHPKFGDLISPLIKEMKAVGLNLAAKPSGFSRQ